MNGLMRIAVLFAASLPFLQAAGAPKAVLVLHTEGAVREGVANFQQRFGASSFQIVIAGERNAGAEIPGANILFMQHPTAEFLQGIWPVAEAEMKRGMKVVTDVPEVVQRQWEIFPEPVLNNRVLSYFLVGGAENFTSLLMVLYQAGGGTLAMTIPPPVERPVMGVYHPDAPRMFANLKEYLAWYRKAKPSQGKLAIVTFFQSSIRDRELKVVDALLAALERQGLAAAGVYGWPYSTIGPALETPPDDPIAVNLCFTLVLSRPEDAVALDKVGVHVIGLMTANQSYEEWAKSDRGVTPDRIASSVSSPERNGATEPITVATQEPDPKTGIYHDAPIPERVEMAARRAHRWIVLEEKPNFDKKLTILYYNNPPGKGNIGASYLNLAPSIVAVLKQLREAGYNVGDKLPAPEEMMAQLERVGRNVELWAPGELERLVENGGVTLIPVERYRKWFDALPKQFRDSVNARWGPPEASTLMTLTGSDGRKVFVIPGVRLGNIFLGPQLLRASSEQMTSAQHSGTIPPPHAYIASYLYYRTQFQADAVIHMGRHGTLEWLPGKNVGQAGWDSSEVLLGDLPNLNYYIMDGDGEALQARRRGAAIDISHLTPMLASAGSQERFRALQKALDNWTNTHEASPELGAQYFGEAMAEARRQSLDTQLSLPAEDAEQAMKKLNDFLETSEDAPIPLSLPILGQPPTEERLREGLLKFVRSGFNDADLKAIGDRLPGWTDQIFSEQNPTGLDSIEPALRERVGKALDEGAVWLRNLRLSPPRELAVLIDVLNGRFLSSGQVGDPLRTPAALPSGRNLHDMDPALFPTKEAWEVGKRMAGQLIERFQRTHGGGYPEYTSMVLWAGETGRNQGAMEAEAFYLMGVAPEWNARGVVDRVTLIPDAELARPRVNVLFTASGLYRDGLADKMLLLDHAARLAAAAGDNALSRRNREVERQLIARGIAPEEAQDLAGARVFSEAPGAYGNGLSNMVELNGEKDQAQEIADLYLAKTNYVYTDKVWGTSTPHLLASQLEGNQVIVHSRSSNLYGIADNDDVYQYVGGLDAASRSVGATPEVLFNNFRSPGKERVMGAREVLAEELNTRNWNPKWIQGMKDAGYAGARQMANNVEYLYGWQATAPENVDQSVWKKTYDVYVADEYDMDLPQFMSKANPFAQQKLFARLLEVDRQGIYRFSKAEQAKLLAAYVKSVSALGVACSANVCGNRKLRTAVIAEARALSNSQLSAEDVAKFEKRFRDAARPPLVSQNPPRFNKLSSRRNPFTGLKIKTITMEEFLQRSRRYAEENLWLLVWVWMASAGLGGAFAVFRRRDAASAIERLLPIAGEHRC
jgi:cobaltochelatase CobN